MLPLEEALRFAGENRSELEKVLAHYSSDPNDSLKYRAAVFLIENMPGHYSYKNAEWLDAYYHELDTAVSLGYDSGTNRRIIESVSEKYQGPKSGQLVLDSHILTSGFLIDNIERAFSVWSGEWSTHISFADFCEYILPYKGTELQPIDNWREYARDMLKGDLDTLHYCDLYRHSAFQAATVVSREIIRCNVQEWPFGGLNAIPVKNIRTLANLPFGACEDYSVLALAVMRSKGIPVAEDFTPQWPFQPQAHAWNIVLTNSGRHKVFSAGSSNPGELHNPDTKMAKVFRRTYAINREIMVIQKAEKYIPYTFRNYFLRDVTDEYQETVDVEIKIPSEYKKVKHKYAYLAVFDNKEWIPVHYGKISGGQVKFAKMGKMCLYLPVFYDESGIRPFSSPFHIAYDGQIRRYEADTANLQIVDVRRKYFIAAHCYEVGKRMLGGKFQAANRSDFRDAVTIYTVPDFTVQSGEVFLDTLQTPYRYWRYYSSEEKHNNLAELYFYQEENDRPVYGKIIGTPYSYTHRKDNEKAAVFDGDPLTFYDALTPSDSWAGMDFGHPVKIRKISYTPRGDGNDITPGDVHELLYWDDDCWNALGKRQATDIKLIYENVPSGTIYWIRNLSRGRDERIFSYENGNLIWW
jgi:hypothetical protein